MKTKIEIHPRFSHLESFLTHLPTHFKYGGRVLHSGRNTIKLFEVKGIKLVVKSYRLPNPLNRWIYAHIRKSKAKRAYRHAARLRELGIATPHEVACIEQLHHGLLRESYFVCLYSEGSSFSEVIQSFPNPEAMQIANAFARFLVRLHEAGVLHQDLNADNIRYRLTGSGYQFELIDTNRMRFATNLSKRQCLLNLRRLTHQTPPYLYIVEHYAQIRGYDREQTLLLSCIELLSFSRWVHWKERRHASRSRSTKG